MKLEYVVLEYDYYDENKIKNHVCHLVKYINSFDLTNEKKNNIIINNLIKDYQNNINYNIDIKSINDITEIFLKNVEKLNAENQIKIYMKKQNDDNIEYHI